MNQKMCQSCGMPLVDESLLGLECNGIKNEDYCKFCYIDGIFAKPDENLKEMINSCIPFMLKEGFTETKARKQLESLLPKLKRWNKDTNDTHKSRITTKLLTTTPTYIIGLKVKTSNDKALNDIPLLWENFNNLDIKKKVLNKTNEDIYALYTDYEGNFTQPYTYFLGYSVNSLDLIPEGMSYIKIAPAKYQVFNVKGVIPNIILETWQYIWQPHIDKKRSYITDFEIYKTSDFNNSEASIYIGIK